MNHLITRMANVCTVGYKSIDPPLRLAVQNEEECWIYRPNRTRLSLEKAKMMATVTFNEWLQRRNWREDFTDAMDSLIESVIELDEGNVAV